MMPLMATAAMKAVTGMHQRESLVRRTPTRLQMLVLVERTCCLCLQAPFRLWELRMLR